MGNLPPLQPPTEREYGEWSYKGPKWDDAKLSPNLLLR